MQADETSTNDSTEEEPEAPTARNSTRWLRRPAGWLLGVILTVLAGLIGSLIVGITHNWIDFGRLPDKFATSPAVTIDGVTDNGPLGWTTQQAASVQDLAQIPTVFLDRERWWHAHGGVPFQQEDISLTFESHRAETVELMNLSVQTDSCTSNPGGSLMYYPPEGYGDVPTVTFNLDSDQGAQEAATTGPDGKSVPYFQSHDLQLGQGEKASLFITVTLHAAELCLWHLVATTLVSGETSSLVFDQQFAVSGNLGTSRYSSLFVGNYLVPTEQRTAGSSYVQVDHDQFCAIVAKDGSLSDCETMAPVK